MRQISEGAALVSSGSAVGARRSAEPPAMQPPAGDLTRLLKAASGGERRDVDALLAAMYADVRRLAMSHLRTERRDHTLQPTALVHEAYLKLIEQRSTDWKDRAHFFGVASRIIRRILVDHAREKAAAKRGGGAQRIALDDVESSHGPRDVNLMALDEALEELASIDERQARIVELKFFGGLTIPEIAEALSIGRRSVDREWQIARSWLFHRLSHVEGSSPHDVA